MYLDTLYTLSDIHVSSCVPAGTNGVILLIYVSVPPRITEIPVRQPSATVGTNLTLTCNASGDPTPNVNWTKEGETAAEFNVSGHKLHLVNVKREDFGSYKCTADNGYGTPATSLAVVNVQCKFYTLILFHVYLCLVHFDPLCLLLYFKVRCLCSPCFTLFRAMID